VPPHGVLLAIASQVRPVAVAAGGVRCRRRRRLHLIDLGHAQGHNSQSQRPAVCTARRLLGLSGAR